MVGLKIGALKGTTIFEDDDPTALVTPPPSVAPFPPPAPPSGNAQRSQSTEQPGTGPCCSVPLFLPLVPFRTANSGDGVGTTGTETGNF